MTIKFLIQRKTGRAYPYTDALMDRGDMVPARYDAANKRYVPLVDFGGQEVLPVPAADAPKSAPVKPVDKDVSTDELVAKVAEKLLPMMRSMIDSMMRPVSAFDIDPGPIYPGRVTTIIPTEAGIEPTGEQELPAQSPTPVTQLFNPEDIQDDHEMMALKTNEIIALALSELGADIGHQRTKKHAIAAYLNAESEKGAK